MGNVITSGYKVGKCDRKCSQVAKSVIITPRKIWRESLLTMALGNGRNRSDIDSHLKSCSKVNGSQVMLQKP